MQVPLQKNTLLSNCGALELMGNFGKFGLFFAAKKSLRKWALNPNKENPKETFFQFHDC